MFQPASYVPLKLLINIVLELLMFRVLLLFVSLLMLLLTNTVMASGTDGGAPAERTPRIGTAKSLAAITYERGKSLFKGRDQRYGKINYCVPVGDELKKVKKKSLQPFAGGSSKVLAENLYNCDVPDQKIQTVFNNVDMTALVFYLNKRNKLKLTR